MAVITTWSWIFVLHFFFMVQPGLARLEQNVSGVLGRRVMEGIFVRGLSHEEKTRNAFIGVAVAASVVLLAGVTALVLVIRRSRLQQVDPEASQIPPVDQKPNWWMVEGTDSKGDWWRLSLQPTSTDAFPITVDLKGGRTERLKTALQLQKAKSAATPTFPIPKKSVVSPADTITLPMQTVPVPEPVQAKKPQALDKAYPIASYPTLSPPQKVRAPAPIVINPALLRTRGHSDRRMGAAVPRSPSQKRRSKVAKHARNPFLPPRTPIISSPMAVTAAQLSHPKLSHPLGAPRSALRGSYRPPVVPKIRPAPLDLPDVKVVRFGDKF
jgi:hypothetical protein